MKPEHKKYILKNIGKKSVEEIAGELDVKVRKIKKFLEKNKSRYQERTGTESSSRRGGKITVLMLAAVIVILGAAIYSNSLNGEFIWDDDYLIKNNIYLRDWKYIPDIFTSDFGAGAGRIYGFYRPLQVFSHMLEYSVWKLDVRGYHAVNLLLHISVALLVFWLVYSLFKDRLLGFLTAVLFISHPIHTEAVDYISGRGDPMGVFFILLALILYVKLQRKDSLLIYLVTLSSCVLALLTKEGALILPFLVILYHISFKVKIKFRLFVSIMTVVCAYLLFRMFYLKSGSFDHAFLSTLYQRIPGFFVAVTNYLKLLVLPFNLHMEYGQKLFHYAEPKAIIGLIIVPALFVLALKKREENRLIFFSIGWFFLALLPVSNLYPVAFYMAEHYLYLASVGVFLLLASGLTFLYRNKKFSMAAVFVTAGIILFFSVLTYNQNLYWSRALLFYKRTLEYAPNSSRVHNTLGMLYDSMGREEEAITHYRRAIGIEPEYSHPYNNIGVIYNNTGRYEEAIPYFEKAIYFNSAYADALNNVAVAYAAVGRDEEAIRAYRNAIIVRPDFAGAYSNLGSVYNKIGRIEESIQMYKKAIELDPEFDNAYYNISLPYEATGRRDEAIASLNRALSINPAHAHSHFKLAEIYYSMAEYDKSIKHCDLAIRYGYNVPPSLIEALKPFHK